MSTWRHKSRDFYAGPQPTDSGLSDEELREFYRYFLMDDKPWKVAGEVVHLRARVAELEDIEVEALRIQTQASLAGDQYAYDLMRTVLGKQP